MVTATRASNALTSALLLSPTALVFYHFFPTLSTQSARWALLNDSLLHQLEVKRVASLVQANRGLLAWAWPFGPEWAPLHLTDHILGGHGLGFPLFLHYQHLPHVLTGVFGACIGVRASSF